MLIHRVKLIFWGILLIGLSVLFTNVAQAGEGQWTSQGPEGGIIGTIVVDPTSPQTVYVSTAGGVFKSVDGGNSWSVKNNGLTSIIVPALAIDPNAPQILYAGASDGIIYKSTNGGNNWNKINNGLHRYFRPTTNDSGYNFTQNNRHFKERGGRGDK